MILLGDLDDLIRIAVIIIFVVGPLLSQFGKQAQKAERRGGRPPAKPGGAPRADRPKGLAAEIERILRQAQQAAAEAQQKAKPAEKRAERATSAPPPAPSTRMPKPSGAGADPPRRRGPLTSTVAQHVQEHIQSRPVSEQARNLARRIEQADEQVEQRLHEAFDHRLGDLDPLASSSDSQGPVLQGTDSSDWQGIAGTKAKAEKMARSRQAAIAGLFHEPDQLRNAFVLAEVIGRPRAEDMGW